MAKKRLSDKFRKLPAAAICLLLFAGCGGVYSDVYDKTGDAVFEGKAQWALSTLTNVNTSWFNAVCVGEDGIYAAGYITGAAEFNFGNNCKVKGGSLNANPVIVKYDEKANTLWANTTVISSSNTSCYFNGIAAGKDGIYVAGSMEQGTFDFGSNVSISNSANNAAFIIKYNFNGNAQWIKTRLNSPGENEAFNCITVAKDGIYAAGSISGTVLHKFGSSESAWVTGASSGTNAVIVKYDFNGNAIWAKTAEQHQSYSILTSGITGISAGADGVYAAGYIYGSSTTPPYYYSFGNSTAVQAVSSDQNLVIIKYDFNGNTLWAKSVSGSGISYSRFDSVSACGTAVYASGMVDYNMTYDLGDSVSVKGGGSTADITSSLLVKYDSEGTTIWAVTGSSPSGRSRFYSVSASDDAVYAAGYVFSTGTFSYGSSVTIEGRYASVLSPSLVKYNHEGKALWAKTATGGNDAGASYYGVSAGSEGIYAAGFIGNKGASIFDFGGIAPAIAGGYVEATWGGNNALLVKYR